MSSIFERFCYNDVDETCAPYFNCTPCHLTLADPSCRRIQFKNPVNCQQRDTQASFHVKTRVEIQNCTILKNQCENDFEECLSPFYLCITNCTVDLRKHTLDKYSNYEGNFIFKSKKI